MSRDDLGPTAIVETRCFWSNIAEHFNNQRLEYMYMYIAEHFNNERLEYVESHAGFH